MQRRIAQPLPEVQFIGHAERTLDRGPGSVGFAMPDRMVAHTRAAADLGALEIEEVGFMEARHHSDRVDDHGRHQQPDVRKTRSKSVAITALAAG